MMLIYSFSYSISFYFVQFLSKKHRTMKKKIIMYLNDENNKYKIMI